MSIIRKFPSLCTILFPLLLFECDNDNKVSCEFAICTDEFRGIGVMIKHKSDSTDYVLTDYKVACVLDNKDITIIDNNLTDNEGFYLIANDNELNIFKNKNVKIEFKGYLYDSLVIQKRFIVSADCCHISLIQGDTLFYL